VSEVLYIDFVEHFNLLEEERFRQT